MARPPRRKVQGTRTYYPIRPRVSDRGARCQYKPHRGGCDNFSTQEVEYPPGTPSVRLCDECLDFFLVAVRRINPELKGVDIRPTG